jgi:DNA-binding MarR family transcriptional regulator
MKSWYQDSLSYQLLRTARLHRTRAAAMLAEIGLHPGQETVLQLLSSKDGQTMSALADAMGVQPPTVTKMITRMGAEGLVTREASPSDGRKVFIRLTQDGQQCARQLKSLWKTLDQDAARGLGAKDRKQLTDLLQSMAAAWMPDSESEMAKAQKPGKAKKSGKAKKAKKAKG